MATRILRVTEQPKSGGQLSFSTNYSVSKQESNPTQSGSMKPRVVVSEKGLNFIQDQKEFSEKKKATPKDASANILRIALFGMAQQKIEQAKSQSKILVLPERTHKSPQPSNRGEVPASKSPAKVSWGMLLGSKESKTLPTNTSLMPSLDVLPLVSSQQEPDSPTSPSRRLLRSSNRIGTASSLSQGSASERIRVSDKVKSRLISLFQSKKSTEEIQPKLNKFLQLKQSVLSVLDAEQQSSAPSRYITKRAKALCRLVTREERETKIKQKLQQVLSGGSKTDEVPINAVLLAPKSILSENCIKEHVDIQKIQKLQSIRNHKMLNPEKIKTIQGSEKFDSHEDIADLNAEFIQIMEGVKATKRVKMSPLSLSKTKDSIDAPATSRSMNLLQGESQRKYSSIRVTTRSRETLPNRRKILGTEGSTLDETSPYKTLSNLEMVASRNTASRDPLFRLSIGLSQNGQPGELQKSRYGSRLNRLDTERNSACDVAQLARKLQMDPTRPPSSTRLSITNELPSMN